MHISFEKMNILSFAFVFTCMNAVQVPPSARMSLAQMVPIVLETPFYDFQFEEKRSYMTANVQKNKLHQKYLSLLTTGKH